MVVHPKCIKFVSLTLITGKMHTEEQIWQMLEEMDTPGFFVTAEMGRKGEAFPMGLQEFVAQKLQKIAQGAASRRFVYSQGGWRIYLTFFPTATVVDERYALKNKVISGRYRDMQ